MNTPCLCTRSIIEGTLALLIAVLIASPVQPLYADDQSLASNLTPSQENTIFLKPARLDVTRMPLHLALDELQSRSGVPVAYSPTLIPVTLLVTCACMAMTVEEAIQVMLRGTRFEALPIDDQLVVRHKPLRSVPEGMGLLARQPPPPSVEANWDARVVNMAQRQGMITGRVIDSQTLQPIVAAVVSIPAAGIGSITRADGTYQLPNVPAGAHMITAQLIGYAAATQTITLTTGGSVVANFELSRQALALDEIVVTGTAGGTVRRAVGNVVSRLDVGDIVQNSPSVRIEQVIGNRVAGVRILTPPSVAGGSSQIRIRGSSSLALAGEPLIYVDGIRLNTSDAFRGWESSTSRLADIDPSTIESVEIIKGPAAATLYGTEASNGVIQITTKRGAIGTASFDASMEGGVSWWANAAETLGTNYWRDPATGEVRSWNQYELEREADRYGRDPLTYGPIQRYTFGVRGGTDIVRYAASLNRSDIRGITRIDRDQRNRMNASITIVPTSNFTLGLHTSRTTGETRGGEMAGAFICRMSCYADPGSIDGEGRGWWEGRPPEAYRYGRTDDRFSRRTTWSMEASHQLTSWFTHRLQTGIDDAGMRRVLFTPRDPEGWGRFWGNAGMEGSRSVSDSHTPTRTVDYGATLTLPLTSQINSATSFGLQYYNRQSRNLSASGSNYAVPSLETISSASEQSGSESFSENTTLGTYVQNQFDWNRRIFLTAAVRADDNSAFGSDFDAAIYPKVSATWVVSEEGFWRSNFLNLTDLRLRSAWGEAGQQPGIFAARTRFTTGSGPGGQPTMRFAGVGNPNLGPERGSELEAGFDAAFMGGRLELQFTWYDRVTKNAIVNTPVRPSEGYPGSRWMNVGRTSSWGTETQLNAEIWTQDPVRWTMGLGFTTMGNRIDELGALDEVAAGGRSQYHVESFPIASIFTWKVVSADFVSGSSGPVTNVMCDSGTGRSGRDMGGSPVPCAEAPPVFFGQVDPSWLVNLNSSWTLLRNMHLTAVVDAAGGHYINADYLAGRNTRNTRNFVYQDDPIFMGNQTWSRAAPVIHTGGFAKLRELTLRYTFPNTIARMLGGAGGADLTGTIYNVATLWQAAKYTPDGQRVFDPEITDPQQDYPGSPRGAGPPLSHGTVRVNVRF